MTDDIETIGLLDDDEIELDRAALALSALDHPGLDLSPYLDLLDEIGESLADAAEDDGSDAQSDDGRARLLAAVFHGEFGFAGDAESYDAPLNADLVRVLDRRRGLPVSLSILYVAAARRLGWTAYALNTPGHVLVRVGEEPGVLIDPFHGGGQVSPERLAALLRGALGPDAVPGPEHVVPMSNRTVLVRLLLNQASRAEQGGDPVRALALYARMTQAAPDHADGWWEAARLQLQLRDVAAARHSLSAMLEITRDPERRRVVLAALAAVGSA